ncbi:hypothetical protein NEOLEDRAFT_1132919 [Neolentinus lepideus HHB14362 ss-1]|uniref:Uncharacterized protein n=1 Tax=Neolentinus lepideus HHB14362 ss-1 TaxID=1314782 RepID=A0A165SZ65_9AGAM|nr:hypothetical protein NEOLEDRAFT_1132919 [Neolentinus lepideus HHB14362 ss-1]
MIKLMVVLLVSAELFLKFLYIAMRLMQLSAKLESHATYNRVSCLGTMPAMPASTAY